MPMSTVIKFVCDIPSVGRCVHYSIILYDGKTLH